MPEKKINVTKPYLPPKREYEELLNKIWENNWLTNNGPLENELEASLADFLEVKNVSLFSNGHSALDIAIKALSLSGEVITTPFTFPSTTHAITSNGLKPVFCDIELTSLNIDITKVEELITENTSAIIPVHVFGNPCDVNAIYNLAKKYDLKVIYDAAHAFGVRANNQSIAKYGDIAMFSLHATKAFHSVEGGVLTYKDNKLKKRFEQLRNFGLSNDGDAEMVAGNAKLSEFHAAMGILNLKYLDKQIKCRKEIADYYNDHLQDLKGIRIIQPHQNQQNYAYFPIIVDSSEFGLTRDQLKRKLEKNGINVRRYFYPLTPNLSCYNYHSNHLINATYVSNNILTLPIYPNMNINDAKYIVEVIRSEEQGE
ncbi:aminotransferase [Pontibacillus chungwhensis BH030062]|uniref:Aminotransferase n=1 Tax=Pontibacillus chungwhensis BH030062 TaxID=1385513 RepID=A0A0A2UXE4_9BACI|nr:DegT/DnrJ/EryC1/StrS family aminotransferase [Pontibacillus chungwhensis]KGP91398.1 aminotransferase [Pontibacillus chungwhensis BH030062]